MEPVKVVIAGPSGSGKSTFVRAIADLTVRSTDVAGNSFVLGRITMGRDLVLYLYGAPSEPQSSGGWETLASGMLGSVVVVDGLAPDGPDKAVFHTRWFGSQPAPMLVAANRAPRGGVDSIARKLDVAADSVIALDCKDRASVRNIVLALLEAALTAASPSAVSIEIQARLG